MINLNEKSEIPLYLQIYEQIKQQIFSGELAAGSKLISTRNLAKSLNVGRNTVEYAYAQLFSEGYVDSKPGSGFYINAIDLNLTGSCLKPEPNILAVSADTSKSEIKYNFEYGELSPEDFPLKIWKKYINAALAYSGNDNIGSYNDSKGEIGLREEIRRYLKASRGVNCSVKQVILCSGTQPCLALIAQLLANHSSTVAVEEPCYNGAQVVFQNNRYQTESIIVEQDGLAVEQLTQSSAKVLYVTPSHQFPTGAVLSIQKRLQLLDWAEKNDAYIIEDDYDSELRYNSKPIPSIQSLDNCGRIIYIGTFSKTLAPALRMSYLVLPEAMLEKYDRLFSLYNNPVPWLEQKTMQYFMENGHWERHLRKINLVQKKKHDTLVRSIRELMGDKVKLHGINAGLHILLELTGITETQAIEKAAEVGIKVYPVSVYWQNKKLYANNMVLLGYSCHSADEIAAGIRLLNIVWFGN